MMTCSYTGPGLALCLDVVNFHLFCRLLISFKIKIQLFRKILSGIPSQCQTVSIQIKTDVLSVLIWVQTVCKGYQQMTLVGKELK